MTANSILRGAGRLSLFAAAFVVPPILVGALSFTRKMSSMRRVEVQPVARVGAPTTPDLSRPVVVFLTSNRATEITDFLAPYELFGASGRVTLLTVAPERKPSPVYNGMQAPGGIWVMPDYSLAEYERVVARAPDVIVVPFYPGYDGTNEPEIVEWLTRNTGPGTRLLSICAGSWTLASSGLLDGKRATSFHHLVPRLLKSAPAVQWETGFRYVEDGNVITSAGLTSGVDATLALIDRMFGREVAIAAARHTGYTRLHFLDDPRHEVVALDLSAFPNAAYSKSPRVAVVLDSGVSEAALAAVVDINSISLAKSMSVAASLAPIRTRHGMTLLPEYTFDDAMRPDSIVVIGNVSPATANGAAALARLTGASLQELDLGGRFPYDVIIESLGRTFGRSIARAAAVNLVYPVESLDLGPYRFPYGWSRGIAIGLVSVTLLVVIRRIRLRRVLRTRLVPRTA